MFNSNTANKIRWVLFIVGTVILTVGTIVYLVYKKRAEVLDAKEIPLQDFMEKVDQQIKRVDELKHKSLYGIGLMGAGGGLIGIALFWAFLEYQLSAKCF